jgi:hypothetical protein
MAYNINQLGINQSKKFRYALSDYTEFHFGITCAKVGISLFGSYEGGFSGTGDV